MGVCSFKKFWKKTQDFDYSWKLILFINFKRLTPFIVDVTNHNFVN